MTVKTQVRRIQGSGRWLVRVTVVALLVPQGAVHGDPDVAPIIVLKARVGVPGPKEVDTTASIIDAQFEAEGFAARPATILRIVGGRMPRPGILDRGLTAADIIRPVELGYDDWSKGLFADAERKLVSARERIVRNPGLLVTDTKNLDATFKGLVALALSQARLGKTDEASETMMELVRMFRARPISRADYGRPAEQLWRTIAKPLLAGGTGQLHVTTENDHAVIFVDGQIRGIGKADVVDLVPGAHHVFVQVPTTAGLQYRVDVPANEDTSLDIKWDVDTALAVTEPWIGFVFATEAERNKEALFAGELARRWGRDLVAVVNTFRIQGEPALIGTLYRSGGKLVRSAATVLDADAPARIRQLARYLSDGTVSSELKVMAQDLPAPPPAAETSSARAPLVPKLAVGAGAAAIAVGGVMYLASADYDPSAPRAYHDTKSPAIGVMLGGSAVLGGGAYLWLRDSAGTLSATLMGAGAASVTAGVLLYTSDEDPGPLQSKRIRDTAPVGLVVGSVGLAASAVGVWLWRRDGEPARRASGHSVASWMPSVGLEPSRGFVSCSGQF